MVAALVGASELPWYLGDMSRHLALVQEARAVIEASGQSHLLERCLRPLAFNARDQGDFESYVRVQSERIDRARLDESKFVREYVPQHARYGLAMLAADYGAALNAAHRMFAINAEFGRWGGWQDVGRALAAAGRHREASEQFSEAIRLQKERGQAGDFGEARQKLARAQLACGDLDAARVSAELAYREIDLRDAYSRTTAATALAMVRDAEGSVAEADRLHREALAANEHTGNQMTENEARLEYAKFLLKQDGAREARPLLEMVRDFYGHPFVIKRRQEAEELLGRCDEVRTT